MPRLLILSTEFPPGPGGIGTHAHQLATQLSGLGWTVAVLTSQDFATDAEVSAFNAAQPFPVERIAAPQGSLHIWIARWRAARHWLREWRPDLMLVTGRRAVWLAGAMLTFRRTPPWVAIGHGSEFELPAAWRRRITRYAFERASTVVCVSQFTRRQMTASNIFPRRVEVIPNGADHLRFAPVPAGEAAATRRSIGLQASDRLVLTVGRVDERKAQDTVIRALPSVLSRFPETQYVIAGLPIRQAEYSRLAADLGVSAHVHFLGVVPSPQVVALMSTADLFVMNSRRAPGGDSEGFGIAVVEAALCGIPAVVSDDAGLPEAILPGRTGLAVPPDDPAATADAILTLLGDDARRHQMGMAARQHALAEQTWEQRASAYLRVLSRLLDA